MAKYKKVVADGYWTDTKEPFYGMVLALDEWDGVEDAEDEGIFYYLDGADPMGEHDDFVVVSFEPIE
jgi:hypothetical protein